VKTLTPLAQQERAARKSPAATASTLTDGPASEGYGTASGAC
jgi:hypothetical protein